MGAGAPLTLAGPGKVWLIHPPAGVHQSAPIWPAVVRKKTFIREGELTMAFGTLATSAGPGKIWLIHPPVGVHQSTPTWPLVVW